MGMALRLENIFPDFAALKTTGFAGTACNPPVVPLAITPHTGSTHLCVSLHPARQSVEPAGIFNPPVPEPAAMHGFAARRRAAKTGRRGERRLDRKAAKRLFNMH